ncbi:MAG: class I SAM-dependent methyltransferase [Candidatus Omnitrophota bacterium]
MHHLDYKNNSVRTRYQNDTASTYDEKREKRKKWKLEMGVVNEISGLLDQGSIVADIPTGTGRILLPLKEASHTVYGIDISMDMLLQTKAKHMSDPVDILRGDAVSLPLRDKSLDYVFCLRLLNWVMADTMKEMLNEFCRVSGKGLIIGVRTQKPMGAFDCIRFGILSLMPVPANVSRWANRIKIFTNRVKGKLKYEARKLRGETEFQTDSVKKEFSTWTYYNKDELFRLFSELGLEIEREYYIDTLCSFSKRVIRPYAIYFLKFREGIH